MKKNPEQPAKGVSTDPEEGDGFDATKRILIIDDAEIDRMILQDLLQQAGYEVESASDGEEGLRIYHQKPADLVITDMVMPGKMGIEVILEHKETYPEAKVIAMSGGGDFGPELELAMASVIDITTIAKPFTPEEVITAVREVLG